MPGFTATTNITIKAPIHRVWEALTSPSLIKQYLFGTDVTTDWKEGGPIVYKGIWEGKQYEDKGTIIKVVPNQTLTTTYWSSLSGTEDKPENYFTITNELKSIDANTTMLTITQDNNQTQETATHAQQNWTLVLDDLKRVLEQSAAQ